MTGTLSNGYASVSIPLIGSNLYKLNQFTVQTLEEIMDVSIPLIGSNLYKYKQAIDASGGKEGVSIPLIGSNLYKFIK